MSGKFKYEGKAEIRHLNTRKEGKDDNDKELACDVKLEMSKVPLAAVLCFDEKLGEFLFLEGGAVRNIALGPIEVVSTLMNYMVGIAGRNHYGAEVKKITLHPRDGYVFNVTLSVSFKPSSSEFATIAEYLADEVDLALAPVDRELELDGGASNGVRKAFDDLADSVAGAGASLTISDGAGNVIVGAGNEHDPLYSEAVAIVSKTGKASISMVQRQLRIGYNRAARLIEQMEKDGYVTPMDNSGARDVTDACRSVVA